MSDDEVTYHYVKGQGWVPRLGPEPEPEPVKTGWTLNGLLLQDDTFYQRMREHQEEAERRMWADAARQWVNTAPMRVTTPAQANPWRQMHQRVATRRNDYYTTGDNWAEDIAIYNGFTPRHRDVEAPPRAPVNPEDIRETRYYPGANVAPEPVRQENQHERRAREYREELERARRRRGR